MHPNLKAFPAVAVAMASLCAFAEPTVYTHYMDPAGHPDDARRAVKPPDRALLGDKTHFMALRHASGPNIKRYVDEDRMGDFVWTYWGYLLRDRGQLLKFIEEMRKRGLYIFDVYAWHAGDGKPTGAYQFHLPDWAKKTREEEYGDHWLGMDNGEQDGAYVVRDARGAEPTGRGRFARGAGRRMLYHARPGAGHEPLQHQRISDLKTPAPQHFHPFFLPRDEEFR